MALQTANLNANLIYSTALLKYLDVEYLERLQKCFVNSPFDIVDGTYWNVPVGSRELCSVEI